MVANGPLQLIRASVSSLWALREEKTNRTKGKNCVSLIVLPKFPPLLV